VTLTRPLSALLDSADAVLDAVRARQNELALSNESLEDLAGFCGGTVNKYLGPSREKMPGLAPLYLMLQAMGLGLAIVEDPEATKRMAGRWTRRHEGSIHDNGRLAQVALRRARPIVMTELARMGAAARWAGMSPEERREHIELMNLGRRIKSLAGKSEAA
jgi:hypothetical protein